uniref:Uncharacterized LOC114647352 n=2 Tax=Erpetoichthys calabaricus TaxID=27687 RepID=A0A8C4RPY8_ERPCA
MALLVLLVSLSILSAESQYLMGETVTFLNKGRNPNGTFQVEFQYEAANYGFVNQPTIKYCYNGDCYHMGTELLKDSDSQIEIYLFGGSTVINALSDKPFDVSFSGCCWNDDDPTSKLQFMTHVDLGVRSDTGLPNRPPITASILIVSVPFNCPTPIKLPVFDPDGDRVRCRFGQSINNECGLCNQISGFTLNETTCEISFSDSFGWSGTLELVIEDFPQQDITLTYSDGSSVSKGNSPTDEPLSKIPFQGSYYLLESSSCSLGDYIPLFLDSTPLNEERITAFVGSQFEFNIIARASLSQVSDIMVTGPLNLNKSFQFDTMTRTGNATVMWTPSENDVGNYIPFWFTALTVEGYQSEIRCIIVNVVPKTPIMTTMTPSNIEANIECTETTMSLFVLKSSVPGLNEYNSRLNDPTCTMTSNLSHLIASLSLNSCGTEIQDNGTAIIFQNEISSFDYPNQIISRANQVEIPFSCAYPNTGQVSASFSPHKADYKFYEAGFGTFTFLFEFYDSSDFTSIIDLSEYPLKVELGQMLYMGISVDSSLENIKLFVDTCRSMPHDDPNDSIYYDIISNGCGKDDTVMIFPTNQTQFNFGLEAYSFIGGYPQVFITCSVILCDADSPDTRCSQGCIDS